jgi:hypothetical protein
MIPCIRCGECCKKEPGCLYGGLELPCEHLTKVDGVYTCAEVINADVPEDVRDDLGIGDGCCQPSLRRRDG